MVRDGNNLDERTATVFEPDTLLASQYFDRVRRRVVDGERRLMAAVLEDGVTAYMKHAGATDSQRAELFADAEAWIESDDGVSFYSFENICAVLDLNAEYLRRGLRAWKRRATGTEAPEHAPDAGDLERRRAS